MAGLRVTLEGISGYPKPDLTILNNLFQALKKFTEIFTVTRVFSIYEAILKLRSFVGNTVFSNRSLALIFRERVAPLAKNQKVNALCASF
jgi:hypothetical protein